MPTGHRSPNAVLVALAVTTSWRCGEQYGSRRQCPPFGSQSIELGLLNTRYVRHKAAVIDDIVRDIIALTETCVRGDDPNAIKLDVTPLGYIVHLSPTTSSVMRQEVRWRGGCYLS